MSGGKEVQENAKHNSYGLIACTEVTAVRHKVIRVQEEEGQTS